MSATQRQPQQSAEQQEGTYFLPEVGADRDTLRVSEQPIKKQQRTNRQTKHEGRRGLVRAWESAPAPMTSVAGASAAASAPPLLLLLLWRRAQCCGLDIRGTCARGGCDWGRSARSAAVRKVRGEALSLDKRDGERD
jgi:hypothetical protein